MYSPQHMRSEGLSCHATPFKAYPSLAAPAGYKIGREALALPRLANLDRN